jgi:osmotically-inducible protein OsmY
MVTATTTRSDEQIQQDVLNEMKWDARVQPNEIGVSVQDGAVALTGWVDNFAKKWAAAEDAHRVRGVVAVANDLEVHLPSSAERTDADIAAAATRALEWDALVPTQRIEVTVAKGWITLTGEVDWYYQKADAERVVRRLAGVRGVTNLIMVHARITPSREDLKRRIEDALVRSAQTDAERVRIEVEGDKVILRGKVRSYAEKEEAERIAWSAPGVHSIDNRITISL